MLNTIPRNHAPSTPPEPAGEVSAVDRIIQAGIIYDEAQRLPRDQAVALIAARLQAAQHDGYLDGHMRCAEVALRSLSMAGGVR